MKLRRHTIKRLLYGLSVAFIFSVSSCRSVKETTSSTKHRGPEKQEATKTANQPVATKTREKKPQVKKSGKIYTGTATYYADSYQGKQTASGELYDRKKYTAAVRFGALPLPFDTVVEVFSIKRNKKVRVKVNDRMGEKAIAIIDLSYKAAQAIGLDIDGRAAVKVRVVREAK